MTPPDHVTLPLDEIKRKLNSTEGRSHLWTRSSASGVYCFACGTLKASAWANEPCRRHGG